MTLNAAAMLDNVIVRQSDDTHNYIPEFRYDFNEKTTKNMVLGSTDRHADNALFYQVIAGQYGDEHIDEYRKQMDFGTAVGIIKDASGTQLTPDVVDAFLRLVDKGEIHHLGENPKTIN